jgi:hypothetical protein
VSAMSERAGSPGAARADGWLAIGISVAFALLYLRTLCPTVYLGDSGEICTAIATGGITHPPGYPLFSLLGRIALALVPWGEPAHRIGWVVALSAGAAVGVLFRLAREIGAGAWAAALAAAAFGLSPTFWSQSVRVEVYSLHVLLAGLTLLAGLRYQRSGSRIALVGTALAFSLGLAHHLTIVLLGPSLAVLCGPRLRTEEGRWARLAALAAVLLIGPALYLLLMAWARAEPLQNWGRPVTLPLLWNHASARFYHNLLLAPDDGFLRQRLQTTWHLLTDTFPAAAWLLAMPGALVVGRRDRCRIAALLLIPGVVFFHALCYRIRDVAPYFLVAWLVIALLIAAALERAGSLVRWRAGAAAVHVGAAALLVALPFCRNWPACNLSRVTWVRDFARHKLESAGPGSVLITEADDDTFPVWYVHDVLKVRPDVVHLERMIAAGTWANYDRDPSLWYPYRLRRQGVPAPIPSALTPERRFYLAQDGYLIDLLNGPLRGRPICLTFFAGGREESRQVFFRWVAARNLLLPQGLTLFLQPRRHPVNLPALLAANDRVWRRIALPDLRGIRTDDEMSPDYVGTHYACSLVNYAHLHEMAGNVARAAALYRRAAAWAPRYEPAVTGWASLRGSTRARLAGS